MAEPVEGLGKRGARPGEMQDGERRMRERRESLGRLGRKGPDRSRGRKRRAREHDAIRRDAVRLRPYGPRAPRRGRGDLERRAAELETVTERLRERSGQSLEPVP